MKLHFFQATVVAPFALCSAADAQADSHYGLAQEIVDLLSETELLLSSCTDEPTTAAALPQLRELAQRAAELKNRQNKLPNSSLQEDINIAALVKDFQVVWGAICSHIERLEKGGLLTSELREVLRIAPTTN